MNRVIAFTDGACSSNRYGGWACEVDGQMFSGSQDHVTNNMMEMWAVLEAVQQVPAYSLLTIVTDSKLVVGWMSQNWKCEANAAIAAIREGIREHILARDLAVRYVLVKGHSVEAGNNRVDKAAAAEAQRCRYSA